MEGGEYSPVFYRSDAFDRVDEGTFWLSPSPDVPSVGWDAALPRIVTWVELAHRDDGTSVFAFNTHFDHQGDEARKQSAILLADQVQAIAGPEGPAFVTGDFNALIEEPLFDPLLQQVDDARAAAPETDDTPTFNGWGETSFPRTIDFVLYRGAEVLRFETVDGDYGVPYVSDHYPVVADFKY